MYRASGCSRSALTLHGESQMHKEHLEVHRTPWLYMEHPSSTELLRQMESDQGQLKA